MGNGFAGGFQTGQQTSTNPFGIILGEVAKAQQRRRSEETKLKQSLELLGEEFGLRTKLEKEKLREKARLEGVAVGGETPSEVPQAEAEGVLQQTGIQQRGKTVTVDPETGEQVFIPEALKDEKTRLQTEKLRRESTPEGRAKLVEEEVATKTRIKAATDKVEAQTKVTLGRLVSRNNLETVSGQFSDLADVWIDAFEEGGAGGFIQAGISGAAKKIGDLPDFLGGAEIGGKFESSGAYEGKLEETILKMMPMLTQQGLKSEGSVRIITSVLQALEKTLPQLGTAPRTAKRQFVESQKSFFRFARTAELLGADFDTVFAGQDPNNVSEEAVSGWVKSIQATASRVKVEGAEADAFNELVDNSFSRFDKIIGDKTKKNAKEGKTSSGIKFKVR